MATLEYILGGLLAVLAIVLIVLIGKQQGKRRGLGNSIAGQGASESYLMKNNIGGKNKSYQKWTLIVAIVFVVLVLALYIVGSVEPTSDNSGTNTGTVSTAPSNTTSATVSETVSDTASNTVSETVSDTASSTVSETVSATSETVSE
jgi:protein translocase SecG subunit